MKKAGKIILLIFVVLVKLTLLAAMTAAFITVFRMRRATLLTIIKRNSRVSVALKETLVSKISKKLFGRIGALAGQNYENYKWQYRSISFALSGGTIFFMLFYSFFHYGVVIHIMNDWPIEEFEENPFYAVRYAVYGLACLFVFVFLFCALGFLRRSVDVRKRDLVAYVSVGISKADMIRMNVIEGVYLAGYALFYGLVGSLISNYAILWLFRGNYLLPFSFPIWGMGYFVVLDLAVGVLYAVYTARRLSKMDILDTIRQV